MRPVKPKSKTQILEKAIKLFAKSGYSGVSMRNIAKAVGISAAALYHHFPDKESLYLQAMAQSFKNKDKILSEAFELKDPPKKRLTNFVIRLSRLINDDPDFLALLQREMLDGDEARLQRLAKNVFQDQFSSIAGLCNELAPEFDTHLLAISIVALVLYHFETKPIRAYLTGAKPEHNDPEIITKHIIDILFYGVNKKYSFSDK